MSRIEKTAAASLAVSFLLLAGITVRSFVLSRRPDPATLPLVKIGDKVRLPGFAPGQARLTLVMVLSSQCPYCVQDLPLYQQLSAWRAASGGELRLVAVLPEKTESGAKFLGGAGVSTDRVLSLAPVDLGVQIMPTLLLLDESGRLKQYWVGELDLERRKELLAVLRASCASCRAAAAAPRVDDGPLVESAPPVIHAPSLTSAPLLAAREIHTE
jgi:hypothetical protein